MKSIDLVEYHSFLRDALPENPIVLDLGANRGHFSRKMKERYGARCIAAEPVPALYDALVKKEIGECYNFAISDHCGDVYFYLTNQVMAGSIMPKTTGNTQQIKVPCIDLKGFIQHAGATRIDLMKIDIEGAEIAMLQSCPDEVLAAVPQITVEFHDFCGLTALEDVQKCIGRLERLGFSSVRLSRVGHQDVLLINRKLVRISALELAWIRYVYRNIKGMARMVRKVLYGRNWAKGYS